MTKSSENTPPGKVYCSFCNKHDGEVKHIIKNNNVAYSAICNECVIICVEILLK